MYARYSTKVYIENKHETMTTIGIDLSINSTGICVNTDGKTRYYIITPQANMTKKMLAVSSRKVQYLTYEKGSTTGTYTEKEHAKSYNVYYIVKHIAAVVKKHKPDMCVMEGVSYGSSGSVADLAGLQYALRCELIKNGYDFAVVTPMELKKHATGNGNADKDEMVFTWEKCDTTVSALDIKKRDDIADAYFLSVFFT